MQSNIMTEIAMGVNNEEIWNHYKYMEGGYEMLHDAFGAMYGDYSDY